MITDEEVKKLEPFLTTPFFEEVFKKLRTRSKQEFNDLLLEIKANKKSRDFNRWIGFLGEIEAGLYFIRKGYDVDSYWPIDIVLSKEGISCLIDVKATSQNKWIPKKYFKNVERQEEAFGISIDEYLRVKILLNPYRVEFNEEDLLHIDTHFSG